MLTPRTKPAPCYFLIAEIQNQKWGKEIPQGLNSVTLSLTGPGSLHFDSLPLHSRTTPVMDPAGPETMPRRVSPSSVPLPGPQPVREHRKVPALRNESSSTLAGGPKRDTSPSFAQGLGHIPQSLARFLLPGHESGAGRTHGVCRICSSSNCTSLFMGSPLNKWTASRAVRECLGHGSGVATLARGILAWKGV